ncbi:MAG: DNA internalization-related competence protein ComEC/Rec2 [Gammaproteobacteria bacterium]|nr:DNA internalization-related competence protein ComEC/Rec2 [Gammaproteobacteria bacterium]
MFLKVISFVAGVILLQWQRTLPDPLLFLLIPPLLFGFLRYPAIRLPSAILLGFLWAAFDARLDLALALPPDLYSEDVSITGTVSSLPEQHSRHLAFEFSIDEMEYQNTLYPSPGNIKLNWYTNEQKIRAGERWHLRVRLKPVHGFMNPAGFDYEGWLFHKGIRTRGYVRNDSLNHRLEEGVLRFSLQRLRQHVRSIIDMQLQHGRAAGLLKALVIGDRSGLSASDWQLFRRTGTNHLVAISGLHISIAGGLVYFLVSLGWRYIPWLALRIAAPKVAAMSALTAGACYAALAGFSIPTQRALVMLAVVTAGIILQAQFRPFRSFALALLIVVVLDPAAVLYPGFWLSFIAVAVIFIGVNYRTGQRKLFNTLCGTQWLIGLGLAPALLVWQQQVPLIAPLVNMVAVPLFSLLIIPLSLGATMLSLIWPDGGYVPMVMADWLLDFSRTMLVQAARFPLRVAAPPALNLYLWIGVAIGTLLLLLPRGIPGRVPGVIMLFPLLLHPPASTPKQGEFRFTLLDVGQGMAAVVQTRHHTLVYDAGPVYSQDFNAGSGILAPFLFSRGITKIDRLILSNGDSDHKGGAAGLIASLDIDRVLSGEPSKITEAAATRCTAGMSWSWDDVSFRILHPDTDGSWSGNNASCVVQVENGAGRLLLTGDIETKAEQRLVTCCRASLASKLTTIPHHGSATSSTAQFVQAVSPIYALAPSGYLNRYGFPKALVVTRWEAQGAVVLNTALTGAIEYLFNPEQGISGPERYRLQASRYWTHLPNTNHRSR